MGSSKPKGRGGRACGPAGSRGGGASPDACGEALVELACSHPLFEGAQPNRVAALLRSARGTVIDYERGTILAAVGENVSHPYIACVLSGLLFHERYDGYGRRTISHVVEPGAVIGGLHAFGGLAMHRTTLIASRASRCLAFDVSGIDWARAGGDAAKSLFCERLLALQARDEAALFMHVSMLSKRTLREKIVAYFLNESRRRGARVFDIPLTQQELADYLCATRSALSVELGRLEDEGILRYERGHITLDSQVKSSGALSTGR